MTTADELLALWPDPHGIAARARSRRDAWRAGTIRIEAAPSHDIPEHAARIDGDVVAPLPAWPKAADLREGDRIVVHVDADPAARDRFARWLVELAAAELPACSVAPCARTAAGLHPLWCIAAARLVLPPHVLVEARHDLVGIRVAQIALGFGADAITGPIAPARGLPLCGVSRPDEHTLAGLSTLVRHAGLHPQPRTA